MSEQHAAVTGEDEWVLVPVPEELVDEVKSHMWSLRLQAGSEEWNVEALREHLASLPSDARRAASAVAERAVDREPSDDIAIADALGVNQREAFAILVEINHGAMDKGFSMVVMTGQRQDPEEGGAPRRPVLMSPVVARMILDLDAAS